MNHHKEPSIHIQQENSSTSKSENKIQGKWNEIKSTSEAVKLAEICGIDPEWLIYKQKVDLCENFDALIAMGMTSERLDRFLDWWHRHDWRGQKGNAPKAVQVRETWKQFEKFLEGGNQQHASATGNNQPKRGIGAVSEFQPGFTSRRSRAAAQAALRTTSEN